MGYDTQYALKATVQKTESEIIEELRSLNEEAEYSLESDGRPSGNDSRWYDHEKDLIEFSKKHPDHLFTLSGEGEEAGDIWTKYFLNGKMQVSKAEIRIEEFDPAKLS